MVNHSPEQLTEMLKDLVSRANAHLGKMSGVPEVTAIFFVLGARDDAEERLLRSSQYPGGLQAGLLEFVDRQHEVTLWGGDETVPCTCSIELAFDHFYPRRQGTGQANSRWPAGGRNRS